MKIIQRKGNQYLLRFVRGERYPDMFIRFLEKEKISGGFFVGLGACLDPEISFYDLKKKGYVTRRFKGEFELLNVTGNVAKKRKETIIHHHVTLADKRYRAFGGHLNGLTVGATLEIFLTITPVLKRQKDYETGLNLLEP